jgi:hypothetical protein
MQCFIFLKSARHFLLGPFRVMRRERRRCRLQACGLQLGPSVNIYQDPGCHLLRLRRQSVMHSLVKSARVC